jgi:hypothetical protein
MAIAAHETDSPAAEPSADAAVRQLEFLRSELTASMKRFEEDSIDHKNLHRRLRYLAFALTALATTLAGAAIAFPEAHTATSLAIVVVTASLGVVTSIEGMRKPAELWIHERTTLYALKDLERDLTFWCDREVIDRAEIEARFARLQAILGASADNWNRDVQLQPGTNANGAG